MYSVCINTCCLQARPVTSSGGIPHAARAEMLQRTIPRLLKEPLITDVIVVGEYESGDGYTYIHSPSVNFDCTDALEQRHQGALAAQSDTVLFLHDDHMPTRDFFQNLMLRTQQFRLSTPWDVFVPYRVSETPAGAFGDGDDRSPCFRELNNGMDGHYVMGHASVIRRKMLNLVPWNTVPKVFTWDVEHTKLLRAAKATIQWADREIGKEVFVYDLESELGATPWK